MNRFLSCVADFSSFALQRILIFLSCVVIGAIICVAFVLFGLLSLLFPDTAKSLSNKIRVTLEESADALEDEDE